MANGIIEGAFKAYWKELTAKDPKLAAYPKSFQNQIKDAFTMGFLAGQTERSIEAEAHKEIDKENRKN
jgi:hypothetical protein